MVEKDLKCIACGSKVTVKLQGLFDTRFGIEGAWNICRCIDCGMEQTVPTPLPEELKKLYETFYNFGGEKGTTYTGFREYFFSSHFYRVWPTIDGDVFFHSVKGSGRLLDIGCNEGRGLRIYKANGFDAEGLELNEVAAKEARAKGFTVYTEAVENFQPEQPYDVIVLSNVLEHSLDPKNMLFHVHRILKPGGKVWISLPNSNSWLRHIFGKYWINWHVPFHIVHFSTDTVGQVLRDAGFKVLKMRHESPALWMAHSFIVRFFAKPGQLTKQLRNPLLVAFLMLVIRIFFFPALWAGNWLGRGDCLVVVAGRK